MLFRRTTLLTVLFMICPLVSFETNHAQAEEKSSSSLKIGDSIPAFQLDDIVGKQYSPSEFADRPIVVLFFGIECPIVKFYSARIKEFQEEFSSQNIAWVGINSNRHDSLREIAKFAKENKLDIPLLKDPGNRIADAFGAARTPEVFFFDADHRLQYRGVIDDQYSYGQQRPKPQNRYLADAIQSVAKGQQPVVAETDAVGCIIGRVLEPDSTSSVTYANQISRILSDRCVSCHRPGEIAPFSLTDYDEVVGWAEMIQEVTKDRRMPPWHASKEHGHFKNDSSLTEGELELIDAWVNAGAPLGDISNLPEPKEYVEGWRIGEPDQEFYIKSPRKVPATGVLDYYRTVVDPGFTEDKWVKAAECKIDNREVVHHIIVAVVDDDSQPLHDAAVDSDFIAATAPGAPPMILPEGYAKLIPAGSKLMFEIHYTPNGTEQIDQSGVGFIYADPSTVKKTVATQKAINTDFRIPAKAKEHEVKAYHRFKQDTILLSLFPHMHLRGKSFKYEVIYPDKKVETLLDVPGYDFNWQNGYEFQEYKFIPAKTILKCTAHFDNSSENFANPDPSRPVYWGDQTFEEMMIGYFDMVLADQDLTADRNSPRTESVLKRLSDPKPLVSKKLISSASKGYLNQNSMRNFGLGLRQAFPQIDRVCVTTVQDGMLTVSRVAQVDRFRKACQSVGESTDAEPCALTKVMNTDRPKAFNDFTEVSEPDLKFMGAVARSSFHVPFDMDNQKGTINFWSSEKDGFPPPIQESLLELVNKSLAPQ